MGFLSSIISLRRYHIVVILLLNMNNLNTKTPQNIESFNPDLKSVLSEIKEGQYLFLIADSKKAFLFFFKKGEIVDSREFMHTGVKKMVKSDSGELHGRNDKLSRHIDKQLHKHLQLIIQQVEIFIKGKYINGVFIGGHKPLHHRIVSELPKALQEKVRGTFITELNISHEELTKHCIHVLSEYSK